MAREEWRENSKWIVEEFTIIVVVSSVAACISPNSRRRPKCVHIYMPNIISRELCIALRAPPPGGQSKRCFWYLFLLAKRRTDFVEDHFVEK